MGHPGIVGFSQFCETSQSSHFIQVCLRAIQLWQLQPRMSNKSKSKFYKKEVADNTSVLCGDKAAFYTLRLFEH